MKDIGLKLKIALLAPVQTAVASVCPACCVYEVIILAPRMAHLVQAG